MSNNPLLHEEVYRGNLANLQEIGILVAGCGALGSNLAETLVRHGCTRLTLLDMDRVETHNLGTQVWSLDHIGMMKAMALESVLLNINEELDLSLFTRELTPTNIKKAVRDIDLVVDCFDNMESRSLLKKYCQTHDIECIHAGLFEDYGEVYWNNQYKVPRNSEDNDQDVCDYPLARNIIVLTVAVLAEEILNYCLATKPRRNNWTITLKDLTITKQ